jgi:hypothetical protein
MRKDGDDYTQGRGAMRRVGGWYGYGMDLGATVGIRQE